MQARIMLAVIPAIIFAAVYTVQSRSVKEVKKPTYADQVYGADSFDNRFGHQLDQSIRRVRTVTIIPFRIAADPPTTPAAVVEPAPEVIVAPPVSTRRRTIRKASLDICQRHNMRKVVTRGGKSWRCMR